MKIFILITCLLQTAFAAPQLISFKDGKVGVNFLGYHAEAGLGGGQNGPNGGLLGGLHASAGTPWGQNAAAGLGGSVNGRSAGILYAGAQATPDVGASAVLGGDTSQGGFSGSEAYANGKVNSHTRTIVAGNSQKRQENDHPQLPPQPVTENVNAIQKIRPPKKFYSPETNDFINSKDFSSNDGVAADSNQTKNIYNNLQDKPAAATSIVLTKTIRKTKFATPLNSDGKYNVAPSSSKSLEVVAKDFNAAPPPSSPLSPTPSSVLSSHPSLNAYNSNGDITNTDSGNNPTEIVITRGRTKLRNHAHHKHRRNHHHQKRINANRQHQNLKTIVKVVEQKQEQQQKPSAHHEEQRHNFPIFDQEQQQHPNKRQLIARPPAPHDLPAPACDSTKNECKSVHREVRSDVVQSALQIPIGILQSLQHSLGNLGSH